MSRTKNSISWAEPFLGLLFDADKAKAEGWFDQASDNHHFGVPAGPGLWVRRNNPVEQCCCHTVWIFVLVKLNRKGQVQKVLSWVDWVFADGHGEDLEVDLFPWDAQVAIEQLASVTRAPELPKRGKGKVQSVLE